VPQNGTLQVLDYESLKTPRGWRGDALPHWTSDDVRHVELQVAETVVCVLHHRNIYGFDAGNGRQVFDLRADDLSQICALLSRDRLLVTGVDAEWRQRARLYDLAHLCDATATDKQMLWDGEVPGPIASDVAVPPQRVAACGDSFYLLSLSGQLLSLSRDGGGFDVIYGNFAHRSLHAWAVGEQIGALIIAPSFSESDRNFRLATFNTQTPEPALETVELHMVRPRAQPRSVLVWERDVLLLDENGTLHRLPAQNPNAPTAKWGVLVGLNLQEVDNLLLIPWAKQLHVVVHCREQLRHRFRHVALDEASGHFGNDLPANPHARDDVSVAFCGANVYVCNLSQGLIERLPLPERRKDGK
jgi:hypothetical protein